MLTIYLCFLAGGAVIPFISFFSGMLGDGVDTDVNTDANIDTDIDPGIHVNPGVDSQLDTNLGSDFSTNSVLSIGLLPTSLLSLSAFSATFGVVGSIMTMVRGGKYITFAIALILGYIMSVIIQTIIKSLRKVQTRNYGIDENELLLYEGKVIDTILPGQLGTVSFETYNNILVSYPARCVDPSLKLKTGRAVRGIEFKEGIVIVEPKNKYEQ